MVCHRGALVGSSWLVPLQWPTEIFRIVIAASSRRRCPCVSHIGVFGRGWHWRGAVMRRKCYAADQHCTFLSIICRRAAFFKNILPDFFLFASPAISAVRSLRDCDHDFQVASPVNCRYIGEQGHDGMIPECSASEYCSDGGTGRRSGLKIHRPQGCASSTLAPSTKKRTKGHGTESVAFLVGLGLNAYLSERTFVVREGHEGECLKNPATRSLAKTRSRILDNLAISRDIVPS